MKRLLSITLLLLASASASMAQSSTLAQRIQIIMDRPEFRHAIFGIEFYSLDAGKPIYSINADKLFTPGSTTKLLTEGTRTARCPLRMRTIHTTATRTRAPCRAILCS